MDILDYRGLSLLPIDKAQTGNIGGQKVCMLSAAVLGKRNDKEKHLYLHSSSICLLFKSFYKKIPVIGTSWCMNGTVFCTDCQRYCSLLSIPFRETIPPGLECSVQKQTLIHFKHSRLNSLQQLSASNHAKTQQQPISI